MSAEPNLFKRVFLPALLVFIAAGLLTRLTVDREFRGFFNPDFLRQWWRVGRVMEAAHLQYLDKDKVSYEKLADTALDHVLEGLDQYTDYLPPRKYDDLTREGDQRFVGIGVEVERRNGRVTVTRVVPNSPAAANDWQEGDQIVAVNDTDVRDFYVSDVVKLLRGEEGTTVKVTRRRPGSDTPLIDPLTRGGFDVPSLRDEQLREDKVGYLRLTQFGRRSGQEVAAALRKFSSQGARGYVLDLRDNPGGLLDASVQVLEAVLPPDSVVVSTRGRPGGPVQVLRTARGGSVPDPKPLVVLINRNSASAAEIVAGALQDTHRAVLVGERSYGKGVVQNVIGLPDGSGMRLTTQQYFLPSGRSIQDKGVVPDVPVPLSDAEQEVLYRQRSDLRRLGEGEFTSIYGFSKLKDPQLETAVGIILDLAKKTNAQP